MKARKLTYRIVLFIILLISVDRGLGWYLESLYEKNRCDYSNGKLNAYLEKSPPDTLFVGSSRVLHMINPATLGSNTELLAHQHKHIYHNAALIDILDQQNKLPEKVLILHIELEDLYLRTEPMLLDQLYSLKYYYHENRLVKRLIDKKGYQERIKFLSSVYRFNGDGWKLLSYPLSNNCKEVPRNGYEALIPSENDSIRLKQSLIDDFKPMHLQKLNPEFENLLRHVQNICSKRGIELILLRGPFYKLHPELDRATAQMRKIASRNNIQFVNIHRSEIAGLENRKFWFDNMHLNDKGAKLYSNHLKSIFYLP